MTITYRSGKAQGLAATAIVAVVMGTMASDAWSQPVDAATNANAVSVYVESFQPKDSLRDIRVNVLNVEYERRIQYDALSRLGAGAIVSGYAANGTSYDPGKLFSEPDGGVYPVDTTGWGLQGLLRLYVIDEPRFTLFVEGAAGIAFFDDQFPPQGTKLNFTRRYGAGGTFKVSDRFEVMGGYRVAHISNGNGDGAPDNPAWDGHGPYLGMRYRF